MIVEAVALKVIEEDKKQAKQEEQKNWRKDQEGLDRLKNLAG